MSNIRLDSHLRYLKLHNLMITPTLIYAFNPLGLSKVSLSILTVVLVRSDSNYRAFHLEMRLF